MQRRRFLTLSGHLATGWWLTGGRAWGQTGGDPAEQAEAAAAGAPEPIDTLPPTRPVPGLNAIEVRLGMSADFTGPGAPVAIEALRGSLAWLNDVNARGGVRGRQVILLAQDDAGDPVRAVRNTRSYFESQEVFCLFNYVGTAALGGALPVLAGAGLTLIGELSGAEAQRRPPFADQVFCLRASHRQEMAALVAALRSVRSSPGADAVRRFGVFFPLDRHGRSGADAASEAVRATGAELVAEGTARPGRTPKPYVDTAVRRLRQAGAQAVLCTGDPVAAAELARATRSQGWPVPIGIGAVLDADRLTADLRGFEADPAAPIFTVRAMPPLEATELPAIQEYRRLVAERRPQPPPELASPAVSADHLSAAGLEGFLNARLLTTALELAGQWPDRDRFRQALEALGGYDLGVAEPLGFAPDRHQGFTTVHLLRWRDGSWRGEDGDHGRPPAAPDAGEDPGVTGTPDVAAPALS